MIKWKFVFNVLFDSSICDHTKSDTGGNSRPLRRERAWGTGPDSLLHRATCRFQKHTWTQVHTSVWSLRPDDPRQEAHQTCPLAHDQSEVFPVLREHQPFLNSIKKSNSISKKKQVRSAAVNHLILKCSPTCHSNTLAHHKAILRSVIYDKAHDPTCELPRHKVIISNRWVITWNFHSNKNCLLLLSVGQIRPDTKECSQIQPNTESCFCCTKGNGKWLRKYFPSLRPIQDQHIRPFFISAQALFKVRLLFDLKAKMIHPLIKKGFYIYGVMKFKIILKLIQANLLAIPKTFSEVQMMDGTTNGLKILKNFFNCEIISVVQQTPDLTKNF